MVTLFFRDWFANGLGAASYQNQNGNCLTLRCKLLSSQPSYVMLHLEIIVVKGDLPYWRNYLFGIMVANKIACVAGAGYNFF